ncbi:MAG: hypothetical protein EAZ99_09080 [Alphaproteobacteria bacterium]|nr:MAG: hypothetical protein EAZ99_09080 [Alphaproteobacteria bacterium]
MKIRPPSALEVSTRPDAARSDATAQPGSFRLLVGSLGGSDAKPPAGPGRVSDQTWLWMLREQGASVGEAKLAKAVTREGNSFTIANDMDLKRALALRDDPAIAGRLERAFAAADAARIEAARLRSAAGPGLVEAHAATGGSLDTATRPANPAAAGVGSAIPARPEVVQEMPQLALASRSPLLTLLAHGIGQPERQRPSWVDGDSSMRLKPPGVTL